MLERSPTGAIAGRTALVSLRAQYGNLGDEVINALLIDRLSKECRVLVLAAGVPAGFLVEVRTRLSHPSRVQFIASGAGFAVRALGAAASGRRTWLFLAAGDVSGAGGRGRSRLLAALDRLPGLGLAQVGCSVSELSAGQAQLYRALAGRPHRLTVRDRRSADVVGAAMPGIDVAPDLAFLLPHVRSSGQRMAVLTFRAAGGEEDERLLARLRPLVGQLGAAGLSPLVTWQVARDAPFCRAIAAELGVPVEDPGAERQSFDQAVRLYSRSALVISNRLHALLIGASRGAAPLALLRPDEQKIRGVFEGAGWMGLLSESAQTDGATLEHALGHAGPLVEGAFRTQGAALDDWFGGLWSDGR